MKSFYKDKVVWITGASSGIGEALVQELAGTGCKIVLSARREKELQRVRKQNKLDDYNSMILPMDLEKYRGLDKLPTKVMKKFGSIDVLINNGGISQRSYAHETSIATYESLMNVNFFGNIALTLAVLPIMREKGSGWISSISSVAGMFGVPLRTGYSATKAALTGFFEALRIENIDRSIKVTLVYPGFVKTQISNNALKGDGRKQGKMDQIINQGLDANECARRILDGIASEKLTVVFAGPRENFAIRLHKYFPSIFAKFLARAKVT
ncbi:SDR family oxidoreductase [Leptospira fluminis]|uniref:SDR family oxidoreductase n=1 Tax=Leptospira fluminis TaxID=2484979 RepID=A0A4R9GQW4_9LEPT|nr:SDR family oxidoreductase [Leptospira fluminis]TGK20122.1 SDR family oxidoreductase [Leptospira fluminis]